MRATVHLCNTINVVPCVRVDAREFPAAINRDRQENAGYERNVSSRMLRRPYPCVLPSVFSPFHTAETAYIESVRTYGKGPQPIMWCGSGAELVKIIIRCISNGINYGGIYMGRGRRQNLRGGTCKTLARPTSRCRRTESTVTLESWVCSCAELRVISCYSG